MKYYIIWKLIDKKNDIQSFDWRVIDFSETAIDINNATGYKDKEKYWKSAGFAIYEKVYLDYEKWETKWKNRENLIWKT